MSDSSARSARRRLISLGITVGIIAGGLAAVGITSHVFGSRTTTATCTVDSVTESPLRDGRPSWRVTTSCGGSLAIDVDATRQTDSEALSLAESLRDGSRYRLTIHGELHAPFGITAYLVGAAPV